MLKTSLLTHQISVLGDTSLYVFLYIYANMYGIDFSLMDDYRCQNYWQINESNLLAQRENWMTRWYNNIDHCTDNRRWLLWAAKVWNRKMLLSYNLIISKVLYLKKLMCCIHVLSCFANVRNVYSYRPFDYRLFKRWWRNDYIVTRR